MAIPKTQTATAKKAPKKQVPTAKRVSTSTARPKIGEPTRDECIDDLLLVADAHPNAEITRNFYRRHGSFPESVWNGHFPKFSTFLDAAGILPEKPQKVKTAAEKVAEEMVFKEAYIFNSATDTYITFLSGLGTNLTLSGDKHRAMKRAYSSMCAKPSSINQICMEIGLPRNYFIAYKQAHGWTHDQDPFTKEEHESRSTENMVVEAQQLSRLEVQKGYQKLNYQEIQADAHKWRDLEYNFIEPLKSRIELFAPKYRPTLLKPLNRTGEKFAVAMLPMDLHYGKGVYHDEVGETYTRRECRTHLLENVEKLADRILRNGTPERVIIPVGSDWFHVDNPQGETTSGTPQDLDGTPGVILTEGMDLKVEFIDLCRQIAPVSLALCKGNHDNHLSSALLMFLSAWYREQPDVEVVRSLAQRNYFRYQNTLVGLTHGNDVKVKELPSLMAGEARQDWSQTKHHVFFTGHLHYAQLADVNGIMHYQCPSLSSADRWHHNRGYVLSQAALAAVLIDAVDGPVDYMVSPRKETATAGFKLKNRTRR